MNLKYFRYKKITFRPKLITSITFVVCLAILLNLSKWQYNRGIYKQKLQNDLEKKLTEDYQYINSKNSIESFLRPNTKKHRFTKIKLDGKLDTQIFFLDNQIVDKKVGFRVLAPFKPQFSEKFILLDLGFINRNKTNNIDFNQLKKITTIQGMINAPATGILLKKDIVIEKPALFYIIQAIDFDLIEQQIQKKFYPLVIQTEKGLAKNFKYVEAKFGVTPEKHFGYSFQWFTLALALVLYYLFVNTKFTK